MIIHALGSPRLRLTLWYIAIIAIVSFAFSGIIYSDVTNEIERGFQLAEVRLRAQNDTLLPRGLALRLLDRDLARAKRSVMVRLVVVNGIIIVASGAAAYILAGKTLRPLEEALEEQKRFTADASHELKTPLTALRTEIEVSLRDKNLKLGEAKQLLKSNLEEVVSLQKLSENLLALTRFSQYGNGTQFTKLDIKSVVDNSVKKVLPMAKAKKIKIANRVGSQKISGAAESLEELFIILLDNAIKYSPDKSTVELTSLARRKKVLIEVSDQGMGISKKDIPHLFDRFYRADLSRSKNKKGQLAQAGGYGLGLSIAKQIVQKHKGEISVESKIGKGSTFKVTFPI